MKSSDSHISGRRNKQPLLSKWFTTTGAKLSQCESDYLLLDPHPHLYPPGLTPQQYGDSLSHIPVQNFGVIIMSFEYDSLIIHAVHWDLTMHPGIASIDV